MIKLKTRILSLLEKKGWSLTELDFRLRRPEGFISSYICDTSKNKLPRDVLMSIGFLLDTPYDEILEMNLDMKEDLTYIYEKISNLHNLTAYGNIFWDRIDGKLAFVSSEESDDIKKAFVRKDKEGQHFPPYYSAKEIYEAGPTYHYRTRNGIDVYISKLVSENNEHTGYDYTNALYLTDKHGHLISCFELSDSPNIREMNIIENFSAFDLNKLYDDLLYSHRDSLYTVF